MSRQQNTPLQTSNPFTVSAYKNADFTAGTGWNDIIYNAEIIDTNNNYNHLTGGYTVPISGQYQIDAQWTVTTLGGQRMTIGIYNNNTEVYLAYGLSVYGATGDGPRTASVSRLVNLTAGHVIYIRSYLQTAARTCAGDMQETWMDIRLVSAT